MSDSFHVTYLLTLSPGERAEKRIRELQLEQSTELPEEVVSRLGMQHVTGSASDIEILDERFVRVTIAWPANNHGNEITQFLNVLFGNISMKSGIAIIDIRWEDVAGLFSGPAFGIERIRKEWGILDRALGCTALKPMGFTSAQLAELAYQFALGGMDIIKDDHGLANQPTARFEERVRLCVQAMDRAAQKTGRRSRYFPNVTAGPNQAEDRYALAAELGADGVLLAPMLAGPALMHHLARTSIELPIMAHPAFSGSYVAHGLSDRPVAGSIATGTQAGTQTGNEVGAEIGAAAGNEVGAEVGAAAGSSGTVQAESFHGFEPGLFYGGMMRALGADFVIYPNTGGRFSFNNKVCEAINRQARASDLPYPASFPTPGGGMQRNRMDYWLDNYGTDTTFLMGGSLFEDPDGIEAASRSFMETLGV